MVRYLVAVAAVGVLLGSLVHLNLVKSAVVGGVALLVVAIGVAYLDRRFRYG